MNLIRKLFSRSSTDPVEPVNPPPASAVQTHDNVVPITSSPGLDAAHGPKDEATQGDAVRSNRVSGLLDSEEIVNFFDEKYFNWGQHNGHASGNGATLAHGRASIIARFQNALAVIVERKHAALHRIESQMLDVEGINPTLTHRLSLACDHLRRDISVLEKQSEIAADGKGWVLEALNQYQSGFVRGISIQCDLDNLGA